MIRTESGGTNSQLAHTSANNRWRDWAARFGSGWLECPVSWTPSASVVAVSATGSIGPVAIDRDPCESRQPEDQAVAWEINSRAGVGWIGPTVQSTENRCSSTAASSTRSCLVWALPSITTPDTRSTQRCGCSALRVPEWRPAQMGRHRRGGKSLASSLGVGRVSALASTVATPVCAIAGTGPTKRKKPPV